MSFFFSGIKEAVMKHLLFGVLAVILFDALQVDARYRRPWRFYDYMQDYMRLPGNGDKCYQISTHLWEIKPIPGQVIPSLFFLLTSFCTVPTFCTPGIG